MSFQKTNKIFRPLSSSIRQYLNAILLHRSERTKQRNPTSLFILDPSLRDHGGHHQDQAKYLLAEAAAMGMPCIILGNLGAERKALGLPVWRHFRVSGYGTVEHGKSHEKHTFKRNEVLFQDLKRLPSKLFNKGDLVIFPAVTRNQILGICQWLGRLTHQGATSPRVAICLMFPPDWPASPSSTQTEAIYGRAVAYLGSTSKVIWTCETESLAKTFEPIIGHRPIVAPVILLPDTKNLPPTSRVEQSTPANPMISVLGYSRAEKGSLIVAEVADRVSQLRPNARFTLQAQCESTQDEDTLVKAFRKIQPSPKIVRGSVDQQMFVRLLGATDIMLLPYDAASYGQRGSGLANQAASLGIPLVASAGCAFADLAEQENRAVLFRSHDTESIATAVIAALDQLEKLKANAAAIAHKESTRAGYLATLLESVQ